MPPKKRTATPRTSAKKTKEAKKKTASNTKTKAAARGAGKKQSKAAPKKKEKSNRVTGDVHPDIALLRDHAFRSVNGLKKKWWTGKDGVGNDVIRKNRQGSVIEIHLGNMTLRGSVDFTKLPPKLKELLLSSNELSGHLDLTQLP